MGGHVGDERPDILLVYPEGNYIRASDDRPFLQIGESKYGKFMLELAVEANVDLVTAVKIALGSMMSTARANLSVGPPYDFGVYRSETGTFSEFRIDSDSPLLDKIREVWERHLLRAIAELPAITEEDVTDVPDRDLADRAHQTGREPRGQTMSNEDDQPAGDRPRVERVSTGNLPSPEEVQALVAEGYDRFRRLREGRVADYIPALAEASPDAFGVCVAGVGGGVVAVGDAEQEFTIQSISKLFVFALVCDALGPEEARRKLGVNSTGLPFDSVMAIELNADRTMNPMVNAGALATTSLVPGGSAEEKFESVVHALSRFAGRRLAMDDEVYESEAETNFRNRGIAHLLNGYGRMYCDPEVATDLYTRQCALRVSARDLAVMGATLADGGVNPLTGERAIAAANCKRVLAVLATAGLYERSGEWLYDVGLPGKSGVSGGLVTVSPGKGGVGTFSPPLDDAGNSVRGQRVTTFLSEALGLNLFTSAPLREGVTVTG